MSLLGKLVQVTKEVESRLKDEEASIGINGSGPKVSDAANGPDKSKVIRKHSNPDIFHKHEYIGNIDHRSGEEPKKDTEQHDKTIFHPSLVLLNPKETPDPEELGLKQERKGWHGYIEWEKYPERKEKAKEYLKKFRFPSVSTV